MTPEDKQDAVDVGRVVEEEKTKAKGAAAGLMLFWIGAPFFYFLSTTQPKGTPSGTLFFWTAVMLGVFGAMGMLAGSRKSAGFRKSAAAKGASEDSFRKCPQCAETIKSEAIKCRYCGSEVRRSFAELAAEQDRRN